MTNRRCGVSRPKGLWVVTALALSLACQAPLHAPQQLTPEPPVAREPEQSSTPVAASVDATWQAVLDVLASRGIPVRTLDREGGRIVTGPIAADPTRGPTWGDCGRVVEAWESKPTKGEVTVLARSQGLGSAIRVTTRWTATTWDVTQQCDARGSWEQELEREVKQKAERAGKGP